MVTRDYHETFAEHCLGTRFNIFIEVQKYCKSHSHALKSQTCYSFLRIIPRVTELFLFGSYNLTALLIKQLQINRISLSSTASVRIQINCHSNPFLKLINRSINSNVTPTRTKTK